MIARCACLIILLLEIRGLSISLPRRKWMALAFYTQLSNIITAASAFLLVLLGQPSLVTVVRYLSTCMLVMTFLVTTCVLIPMGGDPKSLLWTGNGIYHHVLCPILSAISYIVIEKHVGKSWIWLPVIFTFIYGMILLYLNGIGKVDGPYPFFRVRNQSARATVIWVLILLAVITGISTLVCVIAS